MGVRASSTLGDLADDLSAIAKRAPKDMEFAVKHVADASLILGKDLARERSGRHGKLYPRSWSRERLGLAHYELGPDASKPQGGMDFEEGSGRQTSPHHELADTFDYAAPALGRALERRIDRWFWNP